MAARMAEQTNVYELQCPGEKGKTGNCFLVVRGWARRATIMKKGYKQVMKKNSNEIKRM